MTTEQVINGLKVRRDENRIIRIIRNIRIKEQIRAIQKKMVEISFLTVPDRTQHKQLVKELQLAKLKLV